MSTLTSIVVTGGCGYIGSHVAAALLTATPWRVVLVDNFSNSGPDVVKAIALAAKLTPAERTTRLQLVEADLRDERQLEAIGRADAVVHMAALKSVPESVAEPVRYYDNNLRGMVNLLSWMRRRDCGALVYSSSCSVYGDVGRASRGTVTEQTPLATPLSPYAHTKQLNESILGLYPEARRVALRYFNPVGAHGSGLLGDRPAPTEGPSGIAAALCRAARDATAFTVHGDDYPTRDGTCVRDYVHVCDIAEAHVAALRWALRSGEGAAYEIINLGSAEGHTVREAITAFGAATGQRLDVRTGPRRTGDIASVVSGGNKAERLLGWRPQRNLDQMMASAWQWASAPQGVDAD